MKNLKFSPALILRSPLYSFCDYDPDNLQGYLSDPYFIMGVYLASPELYKILENAKYNTQLLNKSQQLSLLKYVNRMHYRPTPFGGFSSISVTEWADTNQICLSELSDLKFHTDWDQEVILKLATIYTAEKWTNTLLYLNPTIYSVKDEYRFVKTHFNFDVRTVKFSLEALEHDPLLEDVAKLFINHLTGTELLNQMCSEMGFTADEAYSYITFLLEIQFILPALRPNITGERQQFTDVETLDSLKEIQNTLPNLHTSKLVAHNINNFFHNKQYNTTQYTFYVNTQRKIIGGLSNAYQQQLTATLTFLTRMLPVQTSGTLKSFMDAFKTRFDQEEIPLLQALDPEMGIDYASLANNNISNELINDLDFTTTEPQTENMKWTAMHKLLLRKWANTSTGIPEITLHPNEPEIAEQLPNTTPLPPSIAVMFRVMGDDILLESVGGVTGAALIGRFTNLDDDVKSIASEIIKAEQTTNPNVLFAEICQLSAIHVDNVNKRAQLYDYEIPVNTISTLPSEKQILLSDLYVSVRNERIIIRSKKLDKEIIPRLTSAYNYAHNDLALFRFLCDLQYQGLQCNLNFDLANFFPGLNCYPRVKFNKVIISPAKWFLTEAEIQMAQTSSTHFNQLSQIKRWPQYITIIKNDQQLVFNTANETEITLFCSCIQGLKKVQIQEFFLPDEHLITEKNNKPHINQFIAFLQNTVSSYHNSIPAIKEKVVEIKRSFSLGSEWIYLKIYCHQQSANNLLRDELLNLLEDMGTNIIEKWFFVRYTDPKPHIRLRILLKTKNLGNVLKSLHYCLNKSIECNLIQEYQSDIYRREIERYSARLIEQVETIFNYSSRLIVQYLKTEEALSYHFLALVSTRDILNIFKYFIVDRIAFTEAMATGLYQEFSKNKKLKISLDQKYRLLRPMIDEHLANKLFYQQLSLTTDYKLLEKTCIELKEQARYLPQQEKTNLAADLIHMHLNRIFPEEQRKHELCVYYILNKHFIAQNAITRKTPAGSCSKS